MTETLKPAVELAGARAAPFPGESEEYAEARRALLEEEIEFRRHRPGSPSSGRRCRRARSSRRTTASVTGTARR